MIPLKMAISRQFFFHANYRVPFFSTTTVFLIELKIGIDNDLHFATHLYQTTSKSSMKSRLRILEMLKIPCFLKTTELSVNAFSVPQISCQPPAFNNELSNRNRPIKKNGMLTKLTAVSPAPANNIRGYAF